MVISGGHPIANQLDQENSQGSNESAGQEFSTKVKSKKMLSYTFYYKEESNKPAAYCWLRKQYLPYWRVLFRGAHNK